MGQRRMASVRTHASSWRQRHLSSVSGARPGVMVFTAAEPACSRNARCTSMPASSRRCLVRRGFCSMSTRVAKGTSCGRPAPSRGSPRRARSSRARSTRHGVNALSGEARGTEVVAASRRDGRVLRLGGLRLRPHEVYAHRDRRKLLGRCGPAAHALAVRQLSTLEPGQRQRTLPIRFELSDGRVHRVPSAALGQHPVVDGQPLFLGLATERNTLRLPAYSRLDVRADRAFKWSGRRLVVFVDVANVVESHEPSQHVATRSTAPDGSSERPERSCPSCPRAASSSSSEPAAASDSGSA